MGGCTFTRTVKSVSDKQALYYVTGEGSENVEITVDEWLILIEPGETKTITVHVTPTGDDWQFGRIKFYTAYEFSSGKPVSSTAMSLAVKGKTSGSTMPGEFFENISEPIGSYTFKNQKNATAITSMSNARYGLSPATVVTLNVPQDNTPTEIYDNQSEVGIIYTTCPSNQKRLVVEVLGTNAKDIDLYLGNGSNPHESLQKAYSADVGPYEYFNQITPTWPTGSKCWILVQNYEASAPGAVDSVKIAYAFVPKATATNFTVTTPTGAIEALTTFNVTVNWNLSASFEDADVWYGYLTLGTNNNPKNDVAKMDINLYKGFDVYLPLILK